MSGTTSTSHLLQRWGESGRFAYAQHTRAPFNSGLRCIYTPKILANPQCTIPQTHGRSSRSNGGSPIRTRGCVLARSPLKRRSRDAAKPSRARPALGEARAQRRLAFRGFRERSACRPSFPGPRARSQRPSSRLTSRTVKEKRLGLDRPVRFEPRDAERKRECSACIGPRRRGARNSPGQRYKNKTRDRAWPRLSRGQEGHPR